MLNHKQTAPVAGRHLIAGRWVERSDKSFPSHSPANREELIGTFPNGTPETAREAVAAARMAYPAWRRLSHVHRAEHFDRLAQLIQRDVDSLARLMARECGKNITECRAEVIEGLHMVQYVFGTGRMPIGQIVSSEIEEKDAFIRRKPWG